MLSTYTDVRADLLMELARDLVGPGTTDEELTDRPTTQYLTGILYPGGSNLEREEDNESNEAERKDDDVDTGTLMATAANPSAIGLTFSVPHDASLRVEASAAAYVEKRSGENERSLWQRRELTIATQSVVVSTHSGDPHPLAPGLELYVRIRKRPDRTVVTLSLINKQRLPDDKTPPDAYCYFQPALRVASATRDAAIFLPGARNAGHSQDPDRRLNNLLYRHVPEFAVGHGCAVEWVVAAEGGNATLLQTQIVPRFEIPQMTPELVGGYKAPGMHELATASTEQLHNTLNGLLTAYQNWIEGQSQDVLPTLADTLQDVGRENLLRCRTTADRIADGILLLNDDSEVREAFQLANQAMFVQRCRTTWLKIEANKRPAQPDMAAEHRWYPFQLAFILQCLRSIAEPAHEDREIVDLLWFPTGGGKTEAYLGLTAFTIFLRRLRGAGAADAAGVTVLMRYTLRLLTLQQFQRAASLIMACEEIRRAQTSKLGKEAISLGLWVGGSAAPNTLKQAAAALKKLLEGDTVFEGNPYQLLSCPWCGARLTPNHYKISNMMIIRCPQPTCAFSSGMPLYLVDEDVYRARPSLLIGTVDKFARLPWLAESSSLFGLPDGRNAPPELIIQDELHLISGPLGTMVGLYETAVDGMCRREKAGPKVIASTATIRRAGEQCRAIFNRTLNQFPPPGLDARDSFFARQADPQARPGRLYVGVHAPGRSMKTALLRVYAALLQKMNEADTDEVLSDPYWTLVGYFNSLRELGGALRLVEDDVRERINIVARRTGSRARWLNPARELNSRRRADEIPEILEEMTRDRASGSALDVLLATNMISVGMDVDRLGLMVVTGQPKMTAEYIQATSRVGRRFPGLVITVYNWTRPRDRSHYERFVGYHSAIYSQVEPTSVTSFSNRARDRGLHAVFITLVRHLSRSMNPEDAAVNFDPASAVAQKARSLILDRVACVEPEELDETRAELDDICSRWLDLAAHDKLLYGRPYENGQHGGAPYLMEAAEFGHGEEQQTFVTLNSLRDVESQCNLFFVRRGR